MDASLSFMVEAWQTQRSGNAIGRRSPNFKGSDCSFYVNINFGEYRNLILS